MQTVTFTQHHLEHAVALSAVHPGFELSTDVHPCSMQKVWFLSSVHRGLGYDASRELYSVRCVGGGYVLSAS